MTKFKMKPASLYKWMAQNKAEYTGNCFYGSLLDNFIVSTKRGYAAIYESYVNAWTSQYEVVFAPYKNVKEVDSLFSEFLERSEA